MQDEGDDERQKGGGVRHAALASGVRRQVLDVLAQAEAPLDAAAIAVLVNLHVTTARFHLEHLEKAGLIRRRPKRVGARGRPRMLFEVDPSTRAGEAQRELSEALADAISEDADGGRARSIRAGEAWAAEHTAELAAANDPGVAPLVHILDRLGFAPEARTDGRSIDLHACPFRAAARRNPGVVCAVHLGLIRGVGDAIGHDTDNLDLVPFVAPELCVVTWGDPPAG